MRSMRSKCVVNFRVLLVVVEMKRWDLLTGGNRLKSTYVLPMTEDLVRFDFEVDGEDEGLVGVLPMLANLGVGRE